MQEESTDNEHIFSARLKGLRARRGITQGDLAAKIGVSPGAVGNWESDENRPQPAQLKKLADFFGVNPEFFFGDGVLYPLAPHPSPARIGETRYGETHYYEGGRTLAEVMCQDKARYTLEWFGDSMEPKFRSGDLLMISPNSVLQEGDVVIAKKTDETILLRVYHGQRENRVTLTAYNSAYPERDYPIEDFRFIHPVWSLIRAIKKRGAPPAQHQLGKEP